MKNIIINGKKSLKTNTSVLMILGFWCPVLALPISIYGMSKESRYWKIYAFLFAYFFAAIAYNFNYIVPNDLTRYFDQVNQYTNMTLVSVFESDYNNLYVKDIIFWVIAKIGDVHLLPFLTTFVVYYVAGYISGYFIYTYNYKDYAIFQFLMIIGALELNIVINYVRNIFAFALVIMGVFRWCIEKKRNLLSVLLIISSIYVHSTAILVVLFIVLLPLMQKGQKLFFIFALFAASVIDIIYKKIDIFSENILGNLIIKAHAYFHDEVAIAWSAKVAVSMEYRIIKIFYLTLTAITILVFMFSLKKDNENARDKEITNFQNYIMLYGVMALSCLPIVTPAYNRFYSGFIIGSSVIMFPIAQKRPAIAKCIYIYSFLGILRWTSYIYIYTYRLPYLATFITNPIYIILNNIVN